MTTSTDNRFFKDLSEKDPEDVCKRTLCRYDSENKMYALSVWGTDYAVYPHQHRVEKIGHDSPDSRDYMELFIVHYLLSARNLELHNQWISEKDIPGGPTFFRGPHLIPTHLISERFVNNTEDFKKRCVQLGGIPVNMADEAYYFNITPRTPVAVLYWKGDEDFPPEAKILYDRTITEHLATDIVYALAVAICERISKV
jgi:Domain of unknown function (DUF3786)